MTRHDDDHRFRNDPRDDRGDPRHAQPGSRPYGRGGGPSYGRGDYEHDDMSPGGVAGGARGYGYVYGPGHGGHGYVGRGSAGRSGSEHAGMGGGYGIGASGQEDHRGKGPKGYRRSDDRIREDVCDCLTDDPMLDAGEIDVQVKDGEVTLSGTVSDRLAKRHAEDMIERVTGVRDVQNNIRVKERDAAGR